MNFRIRKFSDRSHREYQNTHFMFLITFYQKIMLFMRKCGNTQYSQIGQRPQYNKEHAHCTMDNYSYRQALRICDTYRSSTATMVTQMRLNVTLHVHCLSCLMTQIQHKPLKLVL